MVKNNLPCVNRGFNHKLIKHHVIDKTKKFVVKTVDYLWLI